MWIILCKYIVYLWLGFVCYSIHTTHLFLIFYQPSCNSHTTNMQWVQTHPHCPQFQREEDRMHLPAFLLPFPHHVLLQCLHCWLSFSIRKIPLGCLSAFLAVKRTAGKRQARGRSRLASQGSLRVWTHIHAHTHTRTHTHAHTHTQSNSHRAGTKWRGHLGMWYY